jgi:hypothetical protein
VIMVRVKIEESGKVARFTNMQVRVKLVLNWVVDWFNGIGGVDGLQVSGQSFTVLVGDILEGISDPVDDTKL